MIMMKTFSISLLLVILVLTESAVAQETNSKQLGGGLVHMKDPAMEERIKEIGIDWFWFDYNKIYNLKIVSYDVGSVDISKNQHSNKATADISPFSVELEGRVTHKTLYYTFRFYVNIKIDVQHAMIQFTDDEVMQCKMNGLEKKVQFRGYGSITAQRGYDRYGARHIQESINRRMCDIMKAVWAMKM